MIGSRSCCQNQEPRGNGGIGVSRWNKEIVRRECEYEKGSLRFVLYCTSTLSMPSSAKCRFKYVCGNLSIRIIYSSY